MCNELSFQTGSENRLSPAFGLRSDLPARMEPSSPTKESHCSVATRGSLVTALNRMPALSTRALPWMPTSGLSASVFLDASSDISCIEAGPEFSVLIAVMLPSCALGGDQKRQ